MFVYTTPPTYRLRPALMYTARQATGATKEKKTAANTKIFLLHIPMRACVVLMSPASIDQKRTCQRIFF